MTEPPGARLRVGLDGLDRGRVLPRRRGDRTCSCSSTTSSGSPRRAPRYRRFWAACPRPSDTSRSCRPRWANFRSGSRPPRSGSITSIQAIYVPADDYTDPAPATTFAHLDATTNLSRQIVELGIYPAVDPLASSSRILDPRIIGEEHYNVAREVKQDPAELQGPSGHHRDPRDRRAERGRQVRPSAGRGRSRSSSRSPSSWPSSTPASPANTSPCRRASRASR